VLLEGFPKEPTKSAASLTRVWTGLPKEALMDLLKVLLKAFWKKLKQWTASTNLATTH
jgi:hypothetical protein